MGVRSAALGTSDPASGGVATNGYPPPTSAVGGNVAPLSGKPAAVANPQQSAEQAALRTPAIFRMSYPSPGGRKTLELEIQGNKRIQQYLQAKGLVATWLRCRSIDADSRRKVRLRDIPRPGQHIVLSTGALVRT